MSYKEKPEFFDGKVLRWSTVAEMTMGEIVYPSGYQRASHTHERACFHFLFQGGYVEQQGRRTQEFRTSTLAFQPLGHEHSYRASKVISRAFTIEFEETWLARLDDYGITLDSLVTLAFRGAAVSSDYRSIGGRAPGTSRSCVPRASSLYGRRISPPSANRVRLPTVSIFKRELARDRPVSRFLGSKPVFTHIQAGYGAHSRQIPRRGAGALKPAKE